MRIRITKPGIYGAEGEIAVGTELDMKNEPKGWDGRYEVVGGRTTAKHEPVNNDPGKTPAEVLALADGNFMTFKAAAKKVLGDATPASKDEITVALIDKLTDTELKTFLTTKGVTTTDETREQLVELAKAA